MHNRFLKAALVASLATVLSAAAFAQSPNDAATTTQTRDDDRGFDEWGLLGLLGLLGLIPRKRRDDVRDHRTTTPAR